MSKHLIYSAPDSIRYSIILISFMFWPTRLTGLFLTKHCQSYDDKTGRPGCPTRLMVGLHYLKYAFNESDESVLDRFLENPYWQYFCGFEYFQHELPIDRLTPAA